jgi:hypothetical protein
MKQKGISTSVGASIGHVNTVIHAYKTAQTDVFDEMTRYAREIAALAMSLRPGDMVLVNGKEVEVIEKYRHTVLCKDSHGFKLSPRYEDVERI